MNRFISSVLAGEENAAVAHIVVAVAAVDKWPNRGIRGHDSPAERSPSISSSLLYWWSNHVEGQAAGGHGRAEAGTAYPRHHMTILPSCRPDRALPSISPSPPSGRAERSLADPTDPTDPTHANDFIHKFPHICKTISSIIYRIFGAFCCNSK